ncbi:MAG: glycoside hydrolase family 36 protein [Kiritimatiellia bacterium]
MKRLLVSLGAGALCCSALATAMDAKAKVLKTFATVRSGPGEITCDDPRGWTFDVTSGLDAGRDVVTVRISSPVEAVPPKFGVFFRVPGAGVRNVWTCDFSRGAFKVDPQLWWGWVSKYTSQLAKDAPIAVGFGPDEVAPVAIACSETFNYLEFGLYADDRTCEIVGRCEFFVQPVAACTEYEARILLDRRGCKWYDTVRDCADWIAGVNGFRAAEVPEAAYEPLYSTWYAYLQDVHDKTLEQEARHAAAVGMKTMILDDGWQKEDSQTFYGACGDWLPAKSRFPDMKAHVAAVHRAGLKYMLWLGVPFMGKETANAPRFRNMMLSGGDSGILDPRFPEVREYLISTYERVVGEWGFDGVKLDFIDQFQLPNPDPALKDGYAGRDCKSLPQAVDRLMRDVLARLKAIKPDVLVEFRQHYMGPAIRQYGNMIRAADCPDDICSNRRRICDLRLTSGKTAVHSDMLVWSRDETPEGAALPILNALFGTVQYSMILDSVRPDHKAVIRNWIDFTTRHRETLLKGELRPHHPESGYSWVEAESAAERIVAVYSPSVCAACGAADKPVYAINATGTDRMLLEFASAPKAIELSDVFGRPAGTASAAAGVVRLPVPPSGVAKIVW